MALNRSCSIIILTAGLVPAVRSIAGAAVTDWVGDSHTAVRLIDLAFPCHGLSTPDEAAKALDGFLTDVTDRSTQ
jgi:hypothetical protein